MKMLVCVDGSDHSFKAVTEAAKIASGCRIDEVTLLHVYPLTYIGEVVSYTQMEQYWAMQEAKKENGLKILSDAMKMLEDTGVSMGMELKEGQAPGDIIEFANEGQFDMVVVGSRGMGGLKKAFLGSVSSAVMEQVHGSVLVVK